MNLWPLQGSGPSAARSLPLSICVTVQGVSCLPGWTSSWNWQESVPVLHVVPELLEPACMLAGWGQGLSCLSWSQCNPSAAASPMVTSHQERTLRRRAIAVITECFCVLISTSLRACGYKPANSHHSTITVGGAITFLIPQVKKLQSRILVRPPQDGTASQWQVQAQ